MSSFHQIVLKVFESRRLGYGFLLILVLFVLVGYRMISSFHSSVSEEIELKKERLSLMSASVERLGDDGDSKGLEDRLHELEKGLIGAGNSSIAAAILQSSFKKTASKHKVTVISEKPLKSVPEGPYLKVPVEFQLKTGLSGLKSMLYDLRSSSPFTRIDSISIRKTENGMLDVTLILEGAMRGGVE